MKVFALKTRQVPAGRCMSAKDPKAVKCPYLALEPNRYYVCELLGKKTRSGERLKDCPYRYDTLAVRWIVLSESEDVEQT